MADNSRLICRSEALQEKSAGIRFDLDERQPGTTGFVVRFEEKPYAYVNRCAHVAVELDWQEGEFFDADARYLMCATHGALYNPVTGYCLAGPCRGAALEKLPIEERDGHIYLLMKESA